MLVCWRVSRCGAQMEFKSSGLVTQSLALYSVPLFFIQGQDFRGENGFGVPQGS